MKCSLYTAIVGLLALSSALPHGLPAFDTTDQADLAIVISAVNRNDISDLTTTAINSARALVRRKSSVSARVFGANGACLLAWSGPLRNAQITTISARLARLVQKEKCHDLGRAWRVALDSLADGSEMVAAVNLTQTTLDLDSGKWSQSSDALADFPFQELTRRNIRTLFLVNTSAEKKWIEEVAADHGAESFVLACARGEDCGAGVSSWMPAQSWSARLEALVERAIRGRHLAEIIVYAGTVLLCLSYAVVEWLKRRA